MEKDTEVRARLIMSGSVGAIIFSCSSRPNFSNSFLWLELVNDRKCLYHVVDPTLIKYIHLYSTYQTIQTRFGKTIFSDEVEFMSEEATKTFPTH